MGKWSKDRYVLNFKNYDGSLSPVGKFKILADVAKYLNSSHATMWLLLHKRYTVGKFSNYVLDTIPKMEDITKGNLNITEI